MLRVKLLIYWRVNCYNMGVHGVWVPHMASFNRDSADSVIFRHIQNLEQLDNWKLLLKHV